MNEPFLGLYVNYAVLLSSSCFVVVVCEDIINSKKEVMKTLELKEVQKAEEIRLRKQVLEASNLCIFQFNGRHPHG